MKLVLLGPVELCAGDGPVDLGTPRQQAVLATLAVDVGRPVPIETLLDRLWDDAPPAQARNIVYSHLSRIRRLLDPLGARIERRHAGYLLDLDPELVDLHRFQRLTEAAAKVGASEHAEHADERRIALLDEALGLWRGEPLGGLPGRWAERIRDNWNQRRVAAVEQWGRTLLRLKRPDRVVVTAAELSAAHPLVESLAALLLRALHAAGRTAEALDRYADLRRRLADELGTDPGPDLRDLHRALLRGEPEPGSVRVAPRPVPTPAQLPPDVAAFVGRATALRRLDRLLPAATTASAAGTDAAAGTAPAVVISAIDGMAGVGKTALALHWAHRVSHRFDGQLYVNLRGFDPAGAPVTAGEAVRGFLATLGVAPERIPEGLAAQSALYRSLLAGRRILVLLDNAREPDQVRPLLPGSAGCVALVTSRNQLSGLVVADGAQPLTLDLLDPDESRALLARRLGTARVDAEPDAVDAIVARCAGLPLALAIVAARAARHPGFRLSHLVEELREASGDRTGTDLDTFAGADPATDVRAVFSGSYRQLSPAAATLFRLLGRHPGPDVTAAAAASLAGVPVPQARRLLAELAYAHLVSESAPGRFTSHDLLRAYAAELVAADPPELRGAAEERLYDHLLHTAHAAARLVNPHRDPVPLPAPTGGPPAEPAIVPLADYDAAMAWFGAEIAVMLAAVTAAPDRYVWPLAWTLQDYLDRRGRWLDQITAQEAALAAARRRGDRWAQANACRGIAGASTTLGRYEDARRHYEEALTLFADLDDGAGNSNTRLTLGNLYDQQDSPELALEQARLALVGYREIGHRPGEANALNAMGWCHTRLGDHRAALDSCERALAIQEELGDRWGQAYTMDSLGLALLRLGRFEPAADRYRRAAALQRELSNRYYEACALHSLGDVHVAAGMPGAVAVWRQALEILDEIGHPEADEVRAKLAAESVDRL